MIKKIFNLKLLLLLLILLIGGFLRFYNLMWGNGYFFHPDENNMAHSISQLNLNNKLNPNFFAYGQFPLYLVYFSYQFTHLPVFSFTDVPYLSAIFFLRFYSAFAGTITILLIYLIFKKITDSSNFAAISALFTALMPALIQNSHFGTTESLLTLFFILIIYLSLKLLSCSQNRKISRLIVLLALTCGLALATKASAAYFLPTAFLSLIIALKKNYYSFKKAIFLLFLFIILQLVFFILFSPYNLISFKNFWGALNYEAGVANGQIRVFYTRQFEGTAPFLFQMEKIFPYALGWPVFILGNLGFLFLLMSNIYYLISKKGESASITILIFSFLIYLVPNSFLFAKWTRFIAPIFPFFAIFAAYLLFPIYNLFNRIFTQIQNSSASWRVKEQNHSLKLKTFKFSFLVLVFALCILSLFAGLSFFSIYTSSDSRILSSNWIYDNIPDDSYVLSETGNVVDIPILSSNVKPARRPASPLPNYQVVSFDFYHLDENPKLADELVSHLEKADYIFIPSRRIFANHMRFPEKYPLLNRYYNALFDGRLGFELQIVINYQGSKNASWSNFGVLKVCFNNGLQEFTNNQQTFTKRVEQDTNTKQRFNTSDPEMQQQAFLICLTGDEKAEETFTVFDHPVIRIYKKTKGLTEAEYGNILRGI